MTLARTGTRLLLMAVVAVGSFGWWLPAGAAEPIDPFVGEFVGRAGPGGDDQAARDANVSIAKDGDGFIVEWTTTSHLKDGEVSRKTYAIAFRPTGRGAIYGSAMARNKFGGSVPLDPLKGEPFVWAKIEGKTLTVYALLITDDGDYDLQTYDRTLTPEGLTLNFSRLRPDGPGKAITIDLRRARR